VGLRIKVYLRPNVDRSADLFYILMFVHWVMVRPDVCSVRLLTKYVCIFRFVFFYILKLLTGLLSPPNRCPHRCSTRRRVAIAIQSDRENLFLASLLDDDDHQSEGPKRHVDHFPRTRPVYCCRCSQRSRR